MWAGTASEVRFEPSADGVHARGVCECVPQKRQELRQLQLRPGLGHHRLLAQHGLHVHLPPIQLGEPGLEPRHVLRPHEVRGQPGGKGLGAREPPPRQRHAEPEARGQLRSGRREAHVRHDADGALRHGEHGPFRDHTVSGRRGKAEAVAHADAVRHGYDGHVLGQAVQCLDGAVLVCNLERREGRAGILSQSQGQCLHVAA
mmetsp:Transcript_10097/g.30219  ORF Transcript_10097/g.30219 Transcript_10097/m.30219 type:complete len:202 (+) Transcript_10097:366-971(+)